VSLVPIGAAFGTPPAQTAWLISALYLATAIGQPTAGRLADLLGPRRVYLAGTVLVAAGGVLGYLAGSLAVLVVSRVVIGFGTSAAYPAAMALVRRQSRRLRQDPPGRVLGALAITGQASMAVGPVLGGALIAAGGWRLTFLVNVPLAAAGTVAVLAWLPADEPGAGTAPGPGLGLLVRNRALMVTYLRFGVTALIIYGFIYGWTLWLEQAAGRDAAGAGLLMTPSFAVAAVVSAAAARRRRLWPQLLTGAIALAAVGAGLLVLDARSPLWLLVALSVVFGFQNGVNVVANQAAMYAQAPAVATGAAAGLLRTSMYLGAIASASLIGRCYGRQATDAGLHRLAVILVIAAAALLAVTLADRSTLEACSEQ
jgi:MFS family permease